MSSFFYNINSIYNLKGIALIYQSNNIFNTHKIFC